MLIGITGLKGHGKDTIADRLVSNYQFNKVPFANPLKEALKEIFMFSDEQLYGNEKEVPDPRWFGITPRKVMQFAGTELLRDQLAKLIPELGQDVWIHRFKLFYENEKEKNENLRIAISDARFKNKGIVIKKLGGIIIKVMRPGIITNDTHKSETEQNEIEPDIIIINDGSLDELYAKVDKIMSELI